MTKRLLKQNFGHRCSLSKENIIDEILPGKNWKTKLKRFYHKTFMVCENNPRTKYFCTSHNGLVLEKIGHVTKYPYTIHPTSLFRMFWDPFMILIDIITLIYSPLNDTFCIPLPKHIRYECASNVKLALNAICVIDIILNFFTICYDEQKLVVDYRSIAINYFKRSFVWDIISTVPNIILRFMHFQHMTLWMIGLRFLRVFNLVHYLNIVAKLFFIGPNTMRFFIIFLCFFLLIHWAACLLIIVTVMENHLVTLGVPDKKSWMIFKGLWNTSAKLLYVNSLYRGVCYLAGSNDVGTVSGKSYVVRPIMWLSSKIFFAIFVGALMHALNSTYNHKIEYQKCVHELNRFADKKHLTKKLSKQLIDFMRYKHIDGAIIIEKKIFQNISLKMKQDIIVSDRIRYLNNVTFLQNLPNNLLRALCLMFSEHLYLPGDIIVKSGYKIQHFYLIVSGTAACYGANGFELYHMSEGDYWGDVELLFPDSDSKCTVVTLENCRIFTLNHHDFLVVMSAFSKFPEIMEYIKLKFLKHMQIVRSWEKQLLQRHRERISTYNMI